MVYRASALAPVWRLVTPSQALNPVAGTGSSPLVPVVLSVACSLRLVGLASSPPHGKGHCLADGQGFRSWAPWAGSHEGLAEGQRAAWLEEVASCQFLGSLSANTRVA